MVFFSLSNFVILKIMVVENVLEERARPWWFFSCNFSYLHAVPQQNQIRLSLKPSVVGFVHDSNEQSSTKNHKMLN